MGHIHTIVLTGEWIDMLLDKEKINIIMICVRAQLFTNNHRLLRNSPSWRQFKIRSADQGRISLPVHYFFCLFKNRVKSLQEELK